MCGVSFTFWTVCIDFFGNVHFDYQLCIKETHSFLYFMTYKAKTSGNQWINSCFLDNSSANPQTGKGYKSFFK